MQSSRLTNNFLQAGTLKSGALAAIFDSQPSSLNDQPKQPFATTSIMSNPTANC